MFDFIRRLYYISHPPANPSDSSVKPLNFGCLGAARIVPGALVTPSRSHPEVALYAIAARDIARAKAFAAKHGFQKAYGGPTGYQDVIDDPEVDAIYNALPNGLHFEWTMKALKGGKHVLLEKPATNTADEAAQIYALAERKGLVVLEAFHYRFHPAIQRVKEILDSNEVGAIQSITVALTAPAGTMKSDDIRWIYELGGGSTMDPGCYTVNLLHYLASSRSSSVLTASATPYSSKPEHEKVDEQFTATLSFENDIIGEIHSTLNEPRILGIIPRIPNLAATVRCEGGTVEIYNYVLPTYYHYITVTPAKKPRRVEKVYSFNGTAKGEDWWSTYRYQMEAFVDKVKGRIPQTWLEPQETIDNMKCIEAIYAKEGFGSRPQSAYVFIDDDNDGAGK